MARIPASERRLQADIENWRAHPSVMVRELFHIDPDPWQEKVLEAFPSEPYMAMQACKGPGKTSTLSWLGWNFLLTRPHPNIAATSVDGNNLRDNLWKEMAVWRMKAPLLQNLFEWTTTRIFYKKYPETWFMSARTWPKSGDAEQQANTLAGLHAPYIMFLLDETGSIPQAVMVAAEAALSSCIEGHIVQAGNPTHLTGPLYEASKDRKEKGGRWHVTEITADPDDPMRAPRVSIEWARQQIKTYGRDNPWVLVNVFGKFPPSSINALIGEEEVLAAMGRYYHPSVIGPQAKIMGIDVARQGDDASVIAMRHGPQLHNFKRYRNVPNGPAGASIVNREWIAFDPDACFVDATGGLGFTWIDSLSQLGRASVPVQFSSNASATDRYYNKRAEMYFLLVQWIRAGGALPPKDSEGAPELLKALINTTYTFRNDALLLEEKDEIKAKIGFSPDEADAAALTFAEPVSPKQRTAGGRRVQSAVTPGYDAFAEANRISSSMPRGPYSDWDPFRGV